MHFERSKKILVQTLQTLYEEKKRVVGYGATSKSTTILNYCGLNTDFIDYFIDTTKTKQGKFTPGTHIPIIKPKNNIKDDVDYAFLGAWIFKKEILKK